MHFSLPLPPTLNHIYRASHTKFGRPFQYKTQEAKKWQELAYYLICRSLEFPPQLAEPVSLRVDMHLKYNRDFDSSLKLLSDTLQETGVLANDKWIHHAEINKYLKAEKPRLEVYVDTRA